MASANERCTKYIHIRTQNTATALLLTVDAHQFTAYINQQLRLSVSVIIQWHVSILCGFLLYYYCASTSILRITVLIATAIK